MKSFEELKSITAQFDVRGNVLEIKPSETA